MIQKELSYLRYQDVNNLYGWAVSQKLPVSNVEQIGDTSQFKENFIKNCNEKGDEGCFLEVNVQYFESLHKLHNDLTFLPETMKTKRKSKSLQLICMIKLNMLYT